MRGRLCRLTPVAVAIMAIASQAAVAQAPQSATIESIDSGETVTARTAEGGAIAVRLIGIDTPERDECGAAEARDALRRLALDRAVTLTADPAHPPADELGRQWMHVDRADGLDIGRALVQRGWATVVDEPSFQRLQSYLDAEAAASGGVWSRCDGDFHRTAAEQLADTADAFVRRYYRALAQRRYAAAWRMLSAGVRRSLGHGFGRWRAGHASSREVRVLASDARAAGRRAVVTVRLRAGARDVCDGRVVRQRFAGRIVVVARGSRLSIARFRLRKTAGGTPRVSRSQCPRPEPTPPAPSPAPPGPDCQGYSPCLPPGPDVDCAGGSGDGPRYVDGPVRVGGSDPYGLDSDGDGWGCES